ncbi:MAG: hypothetical protein ACE15F_06035 [bacterium]
MRAAGAREEAARGSAPGVGANLCGEALAVDFRIVIPARKE